MKNHRSLTIRPKPDRDPKMVHDEILTGLHYHALSEVAGRLGIKSLDLAERVGVSRSTYHRNKKRRSLLTAHESDALSRHAGLLDKAEVVFDGDEIAARQWITTPQVGLGGAIPLDYAKTTVGFREVEKLLTRIDHGVYA